MSKEALEFYHWMMNNDTIENADMYFHFSDEDMYNEFLKQKNSTKGNDIPHSDIRRMESEGVYEEKFQRNSSNDTTIYFDEWNESPLHHDIDGYEESNDSEIDALKKDAEYDEEEEKKDESRMLGCVMSFANFMTEAYEAEERPIKKETDYNDDEFDY